MQKNTADFMVTIAVVAMIADTFHAQETEEEEEEEEKAAAQCMIRDLVERRKLCGEFSEYPEKTYHSDHVLRYFVHRHGQFSW